MMAIPEEGAIILYSTERDEMTGYHMKPFDRKDESQGKMVIPEEGAIYAKDRIE
jgi:hypothetical protein